MFSTWPRPWISSTKRSMPCSRANTHGSADVLFGPSDQRTGALAARSATCRDLIVNELALNTARSRFCGLFTSKNHVASHPEAIQIHPGNAAQQIHRDRYAWGTYLPDQRRASVEHHLGDDGLYGGERSQPTACPAVIALALGAKADSRSKYVKRK